MDTEQAYAVIGLPPEASREDIEKQYHRTVRKIRSHEIKGTLTLLEEAESRAIYRAYRHILHELENQRSAEYRRIHYGKFKRFAALAERIDHFLYYHKALLIIGLLFVGMSGLGYFLNAQIHKVTAAATSQTVVDELSVLIVSNESVEARLRQWSETDAGLKIQYHAYDKQNKSTHLPSPNQANALLVTHIPDVYIVDRDDFMRLYRMGYLRKLAKWDVYGIALPEVIVGDSAAGSSKPVFAAAVSAFTNLSDEALRYVEQLTAIRWGAKVENMLRMN